MTAIEWTHFPDGYLGVERWRGVTWNPTVGCTRVSPGCDHCYAFELHDSRYAANTGRALRMVGGRDPAPRSRDAVAVAREQGLRLPFPPQYDLPFSTVQLLEDRIDQPRHWKAPRAVFVDSMADLYHEAVPDWFLDRVFAAMADSPRHIFMILTKRPARQRETFERLFGDCPPAHIWPGTSMERNEEVEARVIDLVETRAAVRFVSVEPMLARVDLLPYMSAFGGGGGDEPEVYLPLAPEDQTIHWVLVGGESGSHHRRLDLDWVRDLQDQCRETNVAYFGKQRADRRPGQPLPEGLDAKQWPAAVDRFGKRHPIWRA